MLAAKTARFGSHPLSLLCSLAVESRSWLHLVACFGDIFMLLFASAWFLTVLSFCIADSVSSLLTFVRITSMLYLYDIYHFLQLLLDLWAEAKLEHVLIRELLAWALLWRYIYVNVSGVLMFSALVSSGCATPGSNLCICPDGATGNDCIETWRWLTWWCVFIGRYTIWRAYVFVAGGGLKSCFRERRGADDSMIDGAPADFIPATVAEPRQTTNTARAVRENELKQAWLSSWLHKVLESVRSVRAPAGVGMERKMSQSGPTSPTREQRSIQSTPRLSVASERSLDSSVSGLAINFMEAMNRFLTQRERGKGVVHRAMRYYSEDQPHAWWGALVWVLLWAFYMFLIDSLVIGPNVIGLYALINTFRQGAATFGQMVALLIVWAIQILFVVFILIDPLFQMTIWLCAIIHLYFGKVLAHTSPLPLSLHHRSPYPFHRSPLPQLSLPPKIPSPYTAPSPHSPLRYRGSSTTRRRATPWSRRTSSFAPSSSGPTRMRSPRPPETARARSRRIWPPRTRRAPRSPFSRTTTSLPSHAPREAAGARRRWATAVPLWAL